MRRRGAVVGPYLEVRWGFLVTDRGTGCESIRAWERPHKRQDKDFRPGGSSSGSRGAKSTVMARTRHRPSKIVIQCRRKGYELSSPGAYGEGPLDTRTQPIQTKQFDLRLRHVNIVW